ncbi:MAG: type II CRISPR RNA-guided endonuclease Cas9 [Acidobacteriota bacterium]
MNTKLPREAGENYILGIDLGSNSIGIALIETTYGKIIHTTARVFPAGMDGSEKDWEQGRESSNAAKRRTMRGQRRQTDRRRRRLRKLANLLRTFGWLPSGSDLEFQAAINQWDREHAEKYDVHGNLPYYLRAKALDEELSLMELGRALYHLAQRRGFQSNRKAGPAKDEKPGEVQKGIDEISQAMQADGSRTLGEYFSRLDPAVRRIRSRWTDRKMYRQEFEAIWRTQEKFHVGELSEERRSLIEAAIFFQRPLKSADHLVGWCELIPNQRRAPARNLAYQRFRYLSAFNNLRLYSPEHQERPIDFAEQAKILEELEISEKLTFAAIKKLLGVKQGYYFSIEEGGEKATPGNATAARIYAAVPAFWRGLSEPNKAELVEDLGERFEADEQLQTHLRTRWGLSEEEAGKLAKVNMPAGYGSLSEAAALRVLPGLQKGLPYSTLRKELFGETDRQPVQALLPPVVNAVREVRNPAVLRSLTELRKTVNAFLREFGKPDEVHVELARDLRRSKRERLEMADGNRKNEQKRNEAKESLKGCGMTDPKREDIEKYLMWMECGRVCPYSGEWISYNALFVSPQFEVEHIIPYSRSLDNSFENKTLCRIVTNRLKGKRTPFEAFGHTDDWPAMVERVKRMNNRAKLARFTMEEQDTEKLLEDFSARQLTDTKYASRLAAKYLGCLYGGKSDEQGRQRVFTCAGAVTAILRRIWDMNRVLNDVPDKSRDDHRHHAVDAVAIALSSMKFVKAISDAAAQSQSRRPIRSAMLADPWEGFREELREAILERTEVSYRPVRKLAGALHEETYYSLAKKDGDKTSVHVRKAIAGLTAKELADVVDPAVKRAIVAKLAEPGMTLKKMEDDPPRMPSGVPIRRVRVRKAGNPVSIGEGARQRQVISGDNHHMEVVAELDEEGKPKRWRGEVVSRLEANLRKREKRLVVNRNHGETTQFCFSLSEGDLVQFEAIPGDLRTFKVRGVSTESGGRLGLSSHLDARTKDKIKDDGGLLRPSVNVFMKGKGRKIRLDHLGRVVAAND